DSRHAEPSVERKRIFPFVQSLTRRESIGKGRTARGGRATSSRRRNATRAKTHYVASRERARKPLHAISIHLTKSAPRAQSASRSRARQHGDVHAHARPADAPMGARSNERRDRRRGSRRSGSAGTCASSPSAGPAAGGTLEESCPPCLSQPAGGGQSSTI